jgi:hypothetical protein
MDRDKHLTTDVFGVSRDIPISYVERDHVDDSAYVLRITDHTLREALVETNRPWISVDVAVDSDLTWINGAATITFRFTLKNLGKSPADRTEPVNTVFYAEFGPSPSSP